VGPGHARVFGWLAIASVAYHAVAMVLLHVLAPEVSPSGDMVDAYLGTPYRALSTSTFLALGGILGSLGLGLRSALPPRRSSIVVSGLLVLSAIGFLAVTLVPAAVGSIGSALRPVTLLSIVVGSSTVRRHPPWRRSGLALVAIAVCLVATFAVTFGLLVKLGLGGLANRVVLVLIYAWSLLVARGLVVPAGV
jgi:hypothetical protein